MGYRKYLFIGMAWSVLLAGCDSGSGERAAGGESTTPPTSSAVGADDAGAGARVPQDDAAVAQAQQTSGWPAPAEGGSSHGHDVPKVLNDEGCFACHALKAARIGPPYQAIAARYRSDDGATERLTRKIIDGGGGAWGPVPMISHPHLSEDQARQMVDLILDMTPKA